MSGPQSGRPGGQSGGPPSEQPNGQSGGQPSGQPGGQHVPAPDAPPEARPLRLLLGLGGAGALAGLLVVGAYQTTLPAIEGHRAAALAAAVDEVLGAPHAFGTLYLVDGALVPEPPAGTDPRGLERVYPGWREDGSLIGFALEGARPGFQDVIAVIFGYDPARGEVLGMRVLRHKETPGLGDRIVVDAAWVSQFEGVRPPLVGTKPGTAAAPGEVDMITGATISARTVVTAINEAVARWAPLLEAYGGGVDGVVGNAMGPAEARPGGGRAVGAAGEDGEVGAVGEVGAAGVVVGRGTGSGEAQAGGGRPEAQGGSAP